MKKPVGAILTGLAVVGLGAIAYKNKETIKIIVRMLKVSKGNPFWKLSTINWPILHSPPIMKTINKHIHKNLNIL